MTNTKGKKQLLYRRKYKPTVVVQDNICAIKCMLCTQRGTYISLEHLTTSTHTDSNINKHTCTDAQIVSTQGLTHHPHHTHTHTHIHKHIHIHMYTYSRTHMSTNTRTHTKTKNTCTHEHTQKHYTHTHRERENHNCYHHLQVYTKQKGVSSTDSHLSTKKDRFVTRREDGDSFEELSPSSSSSPGSSSLNTMVVSRGVVNVRGGRP